MPTDGSLKRLGGGRWETRDGRFAIEPQSGTWVVVDNSQTDDLGLPLVRGPFGSLTAAREAIEDARTSGPATSPLAGRLQEAGKAGPRPAKPAAKAPARARGGAAREVPDAPAEPVDAPTPAEPKWLMDLPPADRRRTRELIERLEALGIAEAQEIARAEMIRDQPAMTRLAIERRLGAALRSAKDPGDAVRAAIDVIVAGSDRELDVRWRLVDEKGRPLVDLEVRSGDLPPR